MNTENFCIHSRHSNAANRNSNLRLIDLLELNTLAKMMRLSL